MTNEKMNREYMEMNVEAEIKEMLLEIQKSKFKINSICGFKTPS